ncbi:MAG: alkaline shock response membrane anchor protein AmaP [Clostridia bacterium]|nr:alkaline shock response membrane anchor protein AmaP [Clostridia bacterium]
MKFLDRMNLKIFSVIMVILSIITLFFAFDIINDFEFLSFLKDDNCKYIVLVVSIFLIIAGIKSLFFSDSKEDISDGVLLENPNGKLYITKESIISMIEADVKSYSEVLNQNVKIGFNEEKDLFVELELVVEKEKSIKDLSSRLQSSIKTAVKKSSDIDIKNIDIKIKNIQDEGIKK